MQNIRVLKFGGGVFSSVEKLPVLFDVIGEVATNAGAKAIVVVSAMGKDTDGLIEKIKASGIENPSAREMAAFLPTGENQAASLLAMYLIHRGKKAKSFTGANTGIKTDANFDDATAIGVDTAPISEFFASGGEIAVVAGFQGTDENGNITLLGRNGTDYTAIVLADYFDAAACVFFKDVDGVYLCDPNTETCTTPYKLVAPETILENANGQAKQVIQNKALRHMIKMFDANRTMEITVRNMDLSRERFTAICRTSENELWT